MLASRWMPLPWKRRPNTRTMRVHVALLLCFLPAGQLAVPTGKDSSEFVDRNVSDSEPIRKSAQFIIQIELATRHVTDVKDLTHRLTSVVGEALNAAAAKHFKQNPQTSSTPSWGSNITTEITKVDELEGKTWISFISYLNHVPVLGEVIAQDMELLSSSHISAILHYPFSRLLSSKQRLKESQNRWWIIALMFAAGLLLVMMGWFILFIYYNSCGRPTFSAFNIPKAVYIKDEETQSSPADTIKAADSGIARCATGDAQDSSPPLEVVKKGAGAVNGEAVQEDEKVPNAAPPPSHKMPSIAVENSKSMSIDSWGIEDDHKKLDFGTYEKKRKERPKTAGKTRPLRTTDGRIMGTVANTSVWTEYAAADVVAKNFGIQPSISWSSPHDHPAPARPVVGGIVQFDSRQDQRTTMTNML